MMADTKVIKGDFCCRALSEEDWPAYKFFRLEQFQRMGAEDRLLEQAAFGDDNWKAEVTARDIKLFGLFDKGKMIGMTAVCFHRDQDAMNFSGSYIFDEYRGQKLGNLLYESRLKYARAQNDFKTVQTEIWAENIASRTVAERNGFCNSGKMKDGYCIYVLDREKPKPSSQPQSQPARRL